MIKGKVFSLCFIKFLAIYTSCNLGLDEINNQSINSSSKSSFLSQATVMKLSMIQTRFLLHGELHIFGFLNPCTQNIQNPKCSKIRNFLSTNMIALKKNFIPGPYVMENGQNSGTLEVLYKITTSPCV
jgi:hypothetical protein